MCTRSPTRSIGRVTGSAFLFWERTSGGRDFYQELRRKCEARDPSFAKPKKVKAGKPAATEKKEEGAAA